MKKVLLLLLVIFSIVGLIACSNQNKVEPSPAPIPAVPNNEVPSLTNEEMYGKLMEDYKAALQEYDLENLETEETIVQKYPLVNMVLLMHVARYGNDGVILTYGFYDIDKNGIDELLVGASGSIGAIYSFNTNSNEPCIIFFQDTLERGTLSVYDNGIIVSSGSGGAALHYYEFGGISQNGISYLRLEAIEEEYIEENEKPIYRDNDTRETLSYQSIDDITRKYIAEANEVENICELEL